MTRQAPSHRTLQLSLFDDVVSAPMSLPSCPFGPVPVPAAAPPPGMALGPAASFGAAMAPAVFRHPLAKHDIRLNEHVVAYALRRARRHSIGFVVDMDGLSVAAPQWVGLGEIQAALHDKADWILRKLCEQRQRQQRLQAARIDWRDGVGIPYLGDTVIVVLDARAGITKAGAVLNTDAASLPGVPRMTLHIGLPHTAAPEQIRDGVQSWLQRQARPLFEDRCRHFAAQLGVQYKRLRLSSAQTRWGSASADGSIRLNWRLIHFALPIIDYVVVHELAHLREMNHGPRFWDVVRSVVPGYEEAKGRLKDEVLPVFD